MSNETKRDVFTRVNKFARELRVYDSERMESKKEIDRDYQEDMSAYDAALPDDLPVLPKAVGEYLKMWKHDYGDLFQAFDEGTSTSLDGTKWESVQDWFINTQDRFDIFARAWVLGAWIVDETGEIVKLEAEK